MNNKRKHTQAVHFGPISVSCFTLAACGWIIWIGNLFSIPYYIEGFIPRFDNLTELILSSLFFVILGLTPSLIKATFQKN